MQTPADFPRVERDLVPCPRKVQQQEPTALPLTPSWGSLPCCLPVCLPGVRPICPRMRASSRRSPSRTTSRLALRRLIHPISSSSRFWARDPLAKSSWCGKSPGLTVGTCML
ncbi:RPS6KA1 isoform 8 [Pan troglodytes]|uniref:Ribosomal protein S6 kinase A1 n=2 Tax=Homininae TaxID=207598 RepID=A6NND1_HUMAN|nr:ribosomal protein S6 kinase A1 [Homo sapiens]PNI24423.1 RPS6KA1 isoform 8 [Pan troglodytes]